MPALNFKKQFIDKVESGEKRQTIRATRKNPIKVGDKLYIYYGMRTKHCRKLFETVCQSIEDVEIHSSIHSSLHFYLNDMLVSMNERQEIAESDGFKDFYEMCEWFDHTHGLPFHGQLIKW